MYRINGKSNERGFNEKDHTVRNGVMTLTWPRFAASFEPAFHRWLNRLKSVWQNQWTTYLLAAELSVTAVSALPMPCLRSSTAVCRSLDRRSRIDNWAAWRRRAEEVLRADDVISAAEVASASLSVYRSPERVAADRKSSPLDLDLQNSLLAMLRDA